MRPLPSVSIIMNRFSASSKEYPSPMETIALWNSCTSSSPLPSSSNILNAAMAMCERGVRGLPFSSSPRSWTMPRIDGSSASRAACADRDRGMSSTSANGMSTSVLTRGPPAMFPQAYDPSSRYVVLVVLVHCSPPAAAGGGAGRRGCSMPEKPPIAGRCCAANSGGGCSAYRYGSVRPGGSPLGWYGAGGAWYGAVRGGLHGCGGGKRVGAGGGGGGGEAGSKTTIGPSFLL
mmetsp:Transcript_71661/g.120092  ORF Transcript_71661/g.120092 Transcript_71661/m.120092 type:complete len:233 (-) Transcript_71661:698-1396(-)